MQSLWLNDTQITSLDPINGLAGLRSLYLTNTQITSLAPISGLAGLQTLDLTNTQITSLAPISGLAGLQVLDLTNTQITSLDPISGLAGLQTLNLDNTQITSLEPISGLAGLQTLHLNGTQITSLDPISGLAGLRNLRLNDTQITSLDPINGLAGLRSLYLTNTQITSLAPISGLAGLQTLDLTNTQITSLDPISGLTGLQVLILDNTQITSLDPISGLAGLQVLILDNTQITSLEPISGLAGLQILGLNDTQITSLDPISGLAGLERLWLRNSKIDDLRPTKDLARLLEAAQGTIAFDKGLHFAGCAACDLDPEGLGALAGIADNAERTEKTLAYLQGLEDWPPEAAAPAEADDSGVAPRLTLDAAGQLALDEAGLDSAPDQDDLQDECREKVLTLIEAVGQTNEYAALVTAAEKYRKIIGRPPAGIGAKMLWSVGNTLRTLLDAHDGAVAQGRINEELAPNVAAALRDLMDTHGLFQMGVPGMSEVFAAIREAARGPDSDELRDVTGELVEQIDPGLAEDAQTLFGALKAAAGVAGDSAQMAWGVLRDTLSEAITFIGRKLWARAKLWPDVLIHHDLIAYLVGQQTLIEKFYVYVTGQAPSWLMYVVRYAASLLG